MVPRDAGDHAPSRRPLYLPGKCWAVIIGVSAYEDRRLTLRYAHRDARAIYDFLLTPAGGAFSAKTTRLLIDEQATTRNVTRAMSSFLAAAAKDDLVLIYLACHGAPDETGVGRPLYVLTYDSDLADIAGTAWPMDRLAWYLRRYVRAERIVILADTCHSAGMQAGARGPDLSADVLNRYLGELSASEAGIAYLTSAREDQRSYEDEKWGGGHGAFTWFLLEGLRGGADGFGRWPKDGVVSLDELAKFVCDQVTRETKGAQEPILGPGRYDARLPLAVTGGLDVHAHLELARALLDVGWLVNDPAPFLTAAREALRAVYAASDLETTLPIGTALGGEAFLAAGDYNRAAILLEQGLDRSGNEFPAASWLHLGLARAASHLPGAADALEALR